MVFSFACGSDFGRGKRCAHRHHFFRALVHRAHALNLGYFFARRADTLLAWADGNTPPGSGDFSPSVIDADYSI